MQQIRRKMKIFNEEPKPNHDPNAFVIILDKKEARTLVEIVEAAEKANKRRSSFRAWRKKLQERLMCY